MANQYDVRNAILAQGLNYPINTNQMNQAVSNYSALNQPSNYSAMRQAMTANNAYGGYTPPIQPVNFVDRQAKSRLANQQAVAPATTGTKTPPNWRDNLLNYVLSPKGQGMAQGLLEASGYSEVPVTFGQALAMGLKRGNEAQTSADAKALAERQELMNNLLVQSQIYKNYQPSGNPQHSFRPMTKEEKLAYGIPEDTPARYNTTLDKPEIMSIGSGGTSVTVVNEAEYAGDEDFFKGRGKDFSQTITNIGNISTAADIDNQALNRFEQLSELAKTGKTAELLSDVQGWADSLGLDLSGLDLANMGATQALNSVAGRFVMAQVQKTKGAVSDLSLIHI